MYSRDTFYPCSPTAAGSIYQRQRPHGTGRSDHPTADRLRVYVNRIWKHTSERVWSDTPSNFGFGR